MDSRRERLRRARLYFVTDVRPGLDELLAAALAGGVDMVQLRDKSASDDELVRAAAVFRRLCDEHDALFWLNDRPDLAAACGADGVHVGQDDMPSAEARRIAGGDVLVGLSTHSPEQLDRAVVSGEADQLSVGPVWETPTKEGRPAAGLDYVRGGLKDDDVPLPRIPPLRARGGLRYQYNAFQVGGEIVGAAKQDRVSGATTPTDGYTLVKLFTSYSFGTNTISTITARLDNVTNELYRNHLSLIKDLVPEMGRNFKLLYNVRF